MAFIYKRSWMPNAARLIIGGNDNALEGFSSTLITNSGVVAVGDAIAPVALGAGNGFGVRRFNASTDTLLGILVSVENPATGGQATPDSGTTNTWTVGSANETTGAQLFAKIDVAPWSIYSANFTGTIHTTQKAAFGTFYSPNTGANAGTILESGATRTRGSGGALCCLGVDPDDTTRALVNISASAFFVGV